MNDFWNLIEALMPLDGDGSGANQKGWDLERLATGDGSGGGASSGRGIDSGQGNGGGVDRGDCNAVGDCQDRVPPTTWSGYAAGLGSKEGDGYGGGNLKGSSGESGAGYG